MDWYDVADGPELEQGDILRAVTVFAPVDAPSTAGSESIIDVEAVDLDVVVLTQSCDLENDKVRNVLVAEVADWAEFAAAQGWGRNKRQSMQKAIRRRQKPDLALLAERAGTPNLDWSVVDFERLYTIDVEVLRQHAEQLGDRLRLRSPYREDLSQAFGSFYSRVARPEEPVHFDSWDPPT